MQNEPLHRWLAWLDENSPPELIAEIVGTDEEIKAAEKKLVYVTGNSEDIWAYEMRMMALSDETTRRNVAIEEGHAEGLAKGLAEGRGERESEIARKMKNAGRPASEIAEFTGLSPEAIEHL